MATPALASKKPKSIEQAVALERPPYLLALLAGLVVLSGYVYTLAPTVTFWDAGEFVASSHILGIPHPPGTPMFVILGRVWDALFPIQSTAIKTNLMSATFSASAAAFLFLFVHQALARGASGMDAAAARLFRVAGAFAAVIIAQFSLTNWQNSNETEVYQLAMFSIGVIAWSCWLWRRERGDPRGAHLLLLIIYVLGVALSTHLMGLLVGPAVIAFMYYVLRTEPARDPAERQVQWAEFLVAGSLWVTMVGVGIGSWPIVSLGLILYAVATYYAWRAGTTFFALAALGVAAVGVSGFLYLFIRAGLHPYVNEADPSTWSSLWAVIKREQYPVRSPLDNPMFAHEDPNNPGRSLSILALQVLNYFQYFDWQWAASIKEDVPLLAPARLPFTVLFTALGVWGLLEHRKWDRGSWWFMFGLFATTSVGLIIYLNFKPGFSIARETYPDAEMHEVRERDYFYTISYLVWGLWSGFGIAMLFRRLWERFRQAPLPAIAPVFAVALVPFFLNFQAAGRHHGPSATLARDFAYDMLQGVEPYGIIFTNGDNDTFPLWYIQEAEGFRQDVVVVNLSLINTDWYIRQLRDNPARTYRPDSAAGRLYAGLQVPRQPPGCSLSWADSLNAWARRAHRLPPDPRLGKALCLHTLNDAQIASLQPQLLSRDLVLHVGNIVHRYPVNSPMYVKDIMVLRLIQENLGKRPIYFALTAGTGNRMGLDAYLIQQGLAFKLMPDSAKPGPGLASGLFGTLVDAERTRALAYGAFRFARLFEAQTLRLDPTDENIAGNLAFVFMTLGEAARQQGNATHMMQDYRRAEHLSPTPELRSYLRQLEAMALTPAILGPDTAHRDSAGAGRGARGESGRAR